MRSDSAADVVGATPNPAKIVSPISKGSRQGGQRRALARRAHQGSAAVGTLRFAHPTKLLDLTAWPHTRFCRMAASRIGGTHGFSAHPTPRRATCTSRR